MKFKSCGHAVGFLCACVPMHDNGQPLDGEYDAAGRFAIELSAEDNRRLDDALERVRRVRAAKRDQLERRDRAEWDYFMHLACENSLFKKQAG